MGMSKLKLKRTRIRMWTAETIVNDVKAILTEFGIDVPTNAEIPDAVRALAELARDGQSSMLEVEEEEVAAPGPLLLEQRVDQDLAAASAGARVPELALIDTSPEPEEDFFSIGDGSNLGGGEEPQEQGPTKRVGPVSPRDFAKEVEEKMGKRLEKPVVYRNGPGGGKSLVGAAPAGARKPTLEEQKAILQNMGLRGKELPPLPPGAKENRPPANLPPQGRRR
jgi:hypothetical protein